METRIRKQLEEKVEKIQKLKEEIDYLIDCIIEDNGNEDTLVKTGNGDFDYRTCFNLNLQTPLIWMLDSVKTHIGYEVETLKRICNSE